LKIGRDGALGEGASGGQNNNAKTGEGGDGDKTRPSWERQGGSKTIGKKTRARGNCRDSGWQKRRPMCKGKDLTTVLAGKKRETGKALGNRNKKKGATGMQETGG